MANIEKDNSENILNRISLDSSAFNSKRINDRFYDINDTKQINCVR